MFWEKNKASGLLKGNINLEHVSLQIKKLKKVSILITVK
jgi:hypothetical protein